MSARSLDTRGYYTVPITTFGWCNIDRIVLANTANRTSVTIKDNGKTTKITYKEVSLAIKKAGFEKEFVYLLPKGLYSFMRMKKTDKVYTEKLNSFVEYDLVGIGLKDNQKYAYSVKKVKGGKLGEIKLELKSEAELNRLVSNYSNTSSINLKSDYEYQSNLLALERKKQRIELKKKQLGELKKVLFPCGSMTELEGDLYTSPEKTSFDLNSNTISRQKLISDSSVMKDLEDKLKGFGF